MATSKTYTCAECGVKFESQSKNKNITFCSRRCGKAHRKRTKDIAEGRAPFTMGENRNCEICGGEFMAKTKHQKICKNHSCKIENERVSRLRAKGLPINPYKIRCVICGSITMSLSSRRVTCGSMECIAANSAARSHEWKGTGDERRQREAALTALRLMQKVADQCPFAGYGTVKPMQTMSMDFPSWDCPEMDPLSCGTWQVALVIEERKSMEKAA